MKPVLEILNVKKTYAGVSALAGVSFEVCPGEIVGLLGPSGCGKSTLLGLIAGLETPDEGEIRWEGHSLAGTPPHARGFGLMFQDYALFPHLDVAANIAFGLRYQALSEEERRQRTAELLALVALAGFEDRDVTELSGGEQQRVALARSLAPRPRLLMLDEPLGALDAALRDRLLSDLRRILHSLQQTAVYVTHDQAEAFAVADRVVVMQAGRVEQIDRPEEIYRHPASRFVAQFLGFDNFISGRLAGSGDTTRLETALGTIPWHSARPDESVEVLLRPDGAQLNGEYSGLEIQGVLEEKTFRGAVQRARIATAQGTLRFNFPPGVPLPAAGETIRLAIDPDSVQVFGKSDT